jgi:hypothetical protein
MKQTTEGIFLFSSWQRPLYKEGTYEALAYPQGFIMHFRYSKKYVDDKIWNASKELNGKEALIIAVYLEKNRIIRFFPVRKGRIIRVENDGDMLHAYVILFSDWVLYNSCDEYDSIIKKFDKIPKESSTDHLGGNFISFGCFDQIKFSSELKDWKNIIEIIGNKEPFKKSVFYRINRLYDASSEKSIQITQFDEDKLTRGYELKGGRRYIMEISFYFGKEPPKEAKEALFKIESLDLIRIISNNKKLGFRADKTKFSLSTEKVFWNQLTYVTTKIEDSIEGPELEIPIKLKRTSETYLFSLMILIGLILVTGIIDQFGSLFSENTDAIKLLGTFISTTGTWLLTSYKR